MATTTPDNIWTPDAGDDYALTTDLATMADTIQDALTANIYANGALRVSDNVDRDAKFPAPVQGNRVYRVDKGWTEAYYGTYNVTTNPGGATPAGWYPQSNFPMLVGENLGNTSVVTGSTFANLNSSFGGGTVYRNDGFVNGTGDIDVPLPGIYRVSGVISFPSTASGSFRAAQITSDLGAVGGLSQTPHAGITGFVYIPVVGLLPATTSISFSARHDIGSTQTVSIRQASIEYAGPRRV